MIIRDNRTGKPLFTCDLPEDYAVQAEAGIESYPENQKYRVRISARRNNCTISYQSGDEYIYEKKQVQMPMGFQTDRTGTQSSTGAWYAKPVSLKENLDGIAAQIAGGPVKAKEYYDLPEEVYGRLNEEFRKSMQDFINDTSLLASFSAVPVGMDIRKYLLDGGMGVYEMPGKILAVCMSRTGVECDTLQRQGIMENLSQMPFGQAEDNMYIAASTCEWNIPFICTMITDQKDDLNDFAAFIASMTMNEQFRKETENLKLQVRQFQLQKAQSDAMHNQAMWNQMFASQQQQFAAMDRLSASLSQDLDAFHQNLNQQMAYSDSRFDNTFGGETMDDRIQRMRHESVMGVETYEREDGTAVEYSSQADRVFENNLTQTEHFGTQRYYGDYVPDGWHELKKK